MGGSGGGRGSPIGDISQLKEIAEKELQRGDAPRRNVFISFAQEDLGEVNLLRGQAAGDLSEIEFNDWSVKTPYKSANAAYIKERITERIERASMTVVYISPATKESPWVRWEVERSLELGKRVIGVHKGSSPPRSLPTWVAKHNVKIVPWSKLKDSVKGS